eukprot:TRINITY_DN18635_c0_g1_i1.p1 TRINITY_DN18635_c0_g1~~TRINITY_DN18635_c0_g1_i1.p1  ORF type:complete len:606 (+),score=94.58 TRINITY_DN18635_c0_g1_i1:176-1993(+)
MAHSTLIPSQAFFSPTYTSSESSYLSTTRAFPQLTSRTAQAFPDVSCSHASRQCTRVSAQSDFPCSPVSPVNFPHFSTRRCSPSPLPVMIGVEAGVVSHFTRRPHSNQKRTPRPLLSASNRDESAQVADIAVENKESISQGQPLQKRRAGARSTLTLRGDPAVDETSDNSRVGPVKTIRRGGDNGFRRTGSSSRIGLTSENSVNGEGKRKGGGQRVDGVSLTELIDGAEREAGDASGAGGSAAEGREGAVNTLQNRGDAAVKSADWRRARAMLEHGGIHRGMVEACNNGGLLVRFGSLQAFVPFSQLEPSRIQPDGQVEATPLIEVGRRMVGLIITAQVTDVMEEKGRLVLSEKAALAMKKIRGIQEGQVLTGRVTSLTEFGAFVDIRFPDGTYPLSGLLHLSELSWDTVKSPLDVLQINEEVRVKVLAVDRERKRLALSLKQLQADPLLETLDTLMPPAAAPGATAGAAAEGLAGALAIGANSSTQVGSEDASKVASGSLRRASGEEGSGEGEEEPLPGLASICAELLKEDGIESVTLGRQAVEQRVVSQDLELWLSNAPLESGRFTFLARAGRQVQEVHVVASTATSREDIKAAVQRVTGRVP